MRKKLLLIDDELALVTAWQFRLTASGFDVVTANNGLDGLRSAETESPDLILLDIRMPNMDGFEVCRRIKADSKTADIPVIFMSANIQEDAQRQAMEVGATGFLPKPLDSARVLELINQTLENFPIASMETD